MFGNFGDLSLLILHAQTRENRIPEPQTAQLSGPAATVQGTNSSQGHGAQGRGFGTQTHFNCCTNSGIFKKDQTEQTNYRLLTKTKWTSYSKG